MDDASQRKQVLLPYVRHMLLCENVRTDPRNRNRVTIEGLLSKIPSKEGDFPVRGSFSVFLQLSECRRPGHGGLRIVDGESDEEIYPGKRFQFDFSSDPLRVYGIILRLDDCSFPRPGLYFVEFVFEGTTLAREPLLVR